MAGGGGISSPFDGSPCLFWGGSPFPVFFFEGRGPLVFRRWVMRFWRGWWGGVRFAFPALEGRGSWSLLSHGVPSSFGLKWGAIPSGRENEFWVFFFFFVLWQGVEGSAPPLPLYEVRNGFAPRPFLEGDKGASLARFRARLGPLFPLLQQRVGVQGLPSVSWRGRGRGV